MTMKGGNTDDLYIDDGRLKMAQSLVDQHPDVASVAFKWGRPQHSVDYSPFKSNALNPVNAKAVYGGVNNYGMKLQQLSADGDWVDIENYRPGGRKG